MDICCFVFCLSVLFWVQGLVSGFHSTSVVISKKRIVSRGFCIVYPVCLSHRVFAFSLFCLKNVSLVCLCVLDLSHWSGRVCLRLSIAWLLFSANLSTQFSFPLCQAVPVTCKSRRGLGTGNAGYLLVHPKKVFHGAIPPWHRHAKVQLGHFTDLQL
jgi:hypothetical protein